MASASRVSVPPAVTLPSTHVAPSVTLSGPAPRVPVVRPFTADDLGDVVRLYSTVFGDRAAAMFLDRWRWSQVENLFPDDTPRWVLVADTGVVGYLGTVPLEYRVGGATVRAHTPCDYMVRPDYRFHGIQLMRRFMQSGRSCISCDDMAATIRVSEWLGCRRVGLLQRYVKPLDARALDRRFTGVPLPGFGMWAATRVLSCVDAGRRALNVERPAVEEIHSFDSRFDSFFRRATCVADATVVRDRRFLDWRYGVRSPHRLRKVFAVPDAAGGIVGYAIAFMPLGRSRAGQVMDIQIEQNSQGAGRALIDACCRWLRRHGAWTVHYHQAQASAPIPDRDLRRAGFHPRGGYQILVKQGNAAPGLNVLASRWRMVFGDCEASHSV